MKKKIILIILTIIINSLIISTVTAVPNYQSKPVMDKIDKIEKINSILYNQKNFEDSNYVFNHLQKFKDLQNLSDENSPVWVPGDILLALTNLLIAIMALFVPGAPPLWEKILNVVAAAALLALAIFDFFESLSPIPSHMQEVGISDILPGISRLSSN